MLVCRIHSLPSGCQAPVILSTFLALGILAAWNPSLEAAEGQHADPGKTGLKINSQAPAFSLKAADGQVVRLETLLKTGPVALVFHRSADW